MSSPAVSEAEEPPAPQAGVAPPGDGGPPDNRYVIKDVIGYGGFGRVYRALDRVLGKEVALKTPIDGSTSSPAARLLLKEARLTAVLSHPGIVPVHDLGRLPDGRPYYTMDLVEGPLLADLIRELHETLPAPERPAHLMRLLLGMGQIAETVAYLHRDARKLHLDLKPSNIRVGTYGRLYVLDLGIAQSVSRPDGSGGGTPGYWAPEQRTADASLDARADVHALGAILWEILDGRKPPSPPWEAPGADAWPPAPEPERSGLPRHPGLERIVARAMAWDRNRRYRDAKALAKELSAWLEGSQQRAAALGLVEEADRVAVKVAADRQRAEELRSQARVLLQGVEPGAPLKRKAGAWRLLDRAAEVDQRVADAEHRYQTLLHRALEHDGALPEAHERLADYHLAKREDARLQGDRMAFQAHTSQLRVHASTPRHRAVLSAVGRLTLPLEPSDAQVTLYRYVERMRRLHPRKIGGWRGSVEGRELPEGSYLAVLEAPGRAPVRYPFVIEGGATWDGRGPDQAEPSPLVLPEEGELGRDELFVPAGWFYAGGDPDATDPLPASRIWTENFVIQRFAVTVREYFAFLNALLIEDGEGAALAHAPAVRAPDGGVVEPCYRWMRGRLAPPYDRGWRDAFPVTLICWFSAREYARWVASQGSIQWRLPEDLEWEKAARGTDGRHYPWGFQPELFANLHGARPGLAGPAEVYAFPLDTSPYGLRGAAGNVRDFTASLYQEAFRPLGDRVAITDPGEAKGLRTLKGGAYHVMVRQGRVAGRYVAHPWEFAHTIGFRLAATWHPQRV